MIRRDFSFVEHAVQASLGIFLGAVERELMPPGVYQVPMLVASFLKPEGRLHLERLAQEYLATHPQRKAS